MDKKREPRAEQQYLKLFSVVRQEQPSDQPQSSSPVVIQIRLKHTTPDRNRPVVYQKNSEYWISSAS